MTLRTAPAPSTRPDPSTLSTLSTLGQLLDHAVRTWPDRPALSFPGDGVRVSWAELDRLVAAAADRLAARGIGPGGRVGTMMANRLDYPVTWLACARLGAAMVPSNVNYRSLDTGYVVQHSGVTVVVTDGPRYAGLDEIRADAPEPFHLVDVDRDEVTPGTARGPLAAPVAAETLLNVQYTSGSTGRPKGCLLSHTYWLALARKNVLETPGLGPDDVLLTAQPFSYMDPQWNLASAMAAGAELVVLDRFHPSTFWASVREHAVTFLYCLGVMPTLLATTDPRPDDRDHRVRLVACSGIPVGLHAALEARFGVPWMESYGMTEIGSGAAVTMAEHDECVGSGSIGRATALRELRVVDPAGRAVPRGEIGELVVRGSGLMDGYLDSPEATAQAFRNGWFHTGDLARMDATSLVYLVGRAKEMIRRSGENISPVEVEDAIGSHPAVRLAACVGVPDPMRGEEVKAYVVLRDDTATAAATRRLVEEDLAAHCDQLLAYFKVPRYWTVRSTLPLTASEKVAKAALLAAEDDPRTGAYDRAERRWR